MLRFRHMTANGNLIFTMCHLPPADVAVMMNAEFFSVSVNSSSCVRARKRWKAELPFYSTSLFDYEVFI